MLRAVVVVIALLVAQPSLACEALILAADFGSTDAFAWRRGDVIAIKPDGHLWSTAETIPTFWRVRVSGATAAECEAYVAQVFDADGNLVRLRGRRLDYNTLSTPQKNTLNRGDTLVVTKAQADAYIKAAP